MTNEEMKQVLVKARALIEGNWYGGNHNYREGGSYCAVTAISFTTKNNSNKVLDYFRKVLNIPFKYGYGSGIITWNDNSTEQEVLAGFDKVIATL